MRSILYYLTAVALLFGKLAYAEVPAKAISEKTIIDATWSLYVEQVLGFQYNSPFWTNGTKETGEVGQKGQPNREKNVRAICLGREGDFYVFFTLRSFVDPTFPNLSMQGIKETPLDENGKPFAGDTEDDQSFVRYGRMSLVFYDDQGGGQLRVATKLCGITHADNRNPKCFGRNKVDSWNPLSEKYETIDDVKYEIPHEHISARKHLEFQKMPKISINYIREHDIAMLYVPILMFNDRQVGTLGIENPTLSVKLMLEHNKDLFGFKFILIGQETLDMMKVYNPENISFTGFQKLIKIAGLALDIDTLKMLKAVDKTLDDVIPERLANAKTKSEAVSVIWKEFDQTAVKIVSDEAILKQIKMVLIPAITNLAIKGIN